MRVLAGAFFTTYESVKRILGDNPSSSTARPRTAFTLPVPLIHGVASSTAEMVSCAVLTPAEVIKQNAQVVNIASSSSSSSMSAKTKGATTQVLAKFRTQPWKLWSGYTALVGRNLPVTGLNFPILEFVKGRLVSWREKVVVERRRRVRHREQGSPEGGRGREETEGRRFNPIVETALLTALAACVSGTISSIVTTPIDVVKTRMMLSATSLPSDDGTEKQAEIQTKKKEKLKKAARRGAVAMGRQVWAQEGLRGLFRGGAVRSVWSALGMSIYLGFYEGGRLYLEDRRARRGEEAEKAAL